jgi:hypothetical protein
MDDGELLLKKKSPSVYQAGVPNHEKSTREIAAIPDGFNIIDRPNNSRFWDTLALS